MSPRKLANTLISEAKERGEKEALKRFLSFVEKRNLIHLLPAVLEYLLRVKQKEERENTLEIQSAFDLSDTLSKHIASYVGADDAFKVRETVNPDLIGGFRAQYKGKLVDATIRRQLTKLRQRLVS